MCSKQVLDSATVQADAVRAIGERLVVTARAEMELTDGQPSAALARLEKLIAVIPRAERLAVDAIGLHAGKVAEAADVSAGRTLAEAVVPHLWLLAARALAVLDRTSEAETLLQEAADCAREHGARPILWRILHERGRLCVAARRLDAANQYYSEAVAIVRELSAGLPEGELRENFIRSAAGMFPRSATHEFGQPGVPAFAGLTRREREVAALLAQGISNRAIADALVVSERTVEKHAENIMSKLGFSSRAQVAVWAASKLQ